MNELAIPNVQQQTCYTCGPASLLSVLRYLRVANRASERSLAKEMGTTAEVGTTDVAMYDAAAKRWPRVELQTGLGHMDLVSATARGDVLILSIQAWSDGTKPVGPYGGLRDGHYVVLTAADEERAVFMDPSSRTRRVLGRRELTYRWVETCDDGYGVYYGGALIFGAHPDTRWRRVNWKRVEDLG